MRSRRQSVQALLVTCTKMMDGGFVVVDGIVVVEAENPPK